MRHVSFGLVSSKYKNFPILPFIPHSEMFILINGLNRISDNILMVTDKLKHLDW
jgi:hypothetical protein